jgi:hypothetical protein
MLKALPTSQTSLPAIIEKNLVFIDKTAFISTYEKSQHVVSLFLRPRRFGKTMFTEILKYYYDAALKDESSGIFSNTYVATHPTSLKSAFHVVKFDFSGIDTSGGTGAVLDSFKFKIIKGIDDFFGRYPDTIPGDIRKLALSSAKGELSKAVFKYYGDTSLFPTAGRGTDDFITYLKAFPKKVMVIIDEYDNFTNDILSRNVGVFAEIARKEGDVSKFYQVLRSCQQQGIIDRIFITGVLPITLDTSLSGFVSDKIYLDAKFNEMAGFSDTEVAELLEETVDFDKCEFSPDDLRKEMKERYDGYRFSEVADNSVYNPALCLKFISDLISGRYKKLPPLQTVSGNDMDFEKFSGYLNLVAGQDLNNIINVLDTKRKNGSGKGYLGVSALSESLKITSEGSKLNAGAGATLLYHLGFLTIMSADEARETVSGYQENMTYLKIPNNYYRGLFEQFQLSRYPEVFSAVQNDTWGIGELSEKNDIRCLENLLNSVSRAFVKTSDPAEGESQLVLTVYLALRFMAGSSFELTREYFIRHNNEYTLADGLDDDEYQPVDEKAVEKELLNTGVIAAPESSGNKAAEERESRPEKTFEGFRSRFRKREQAVTVSIRKGRADLVAQNLRGGPSYIFEFKYQKDSDAREETKDKVCAILFQRAVKQLIFYATDEKLSRIPDLHKYVIMYAYGEFFIEEVP